MEIEIERPVSDERRRKKKKKSSDSIRINEEDIRAHSF